MHHLPPLATLQAFDAVARTGSVQAAAEALHLTPSAVSHRIRSLERWLGQPVLVREHRRVRLTENGERYHAAIARALDTMAAATQALYGDGRHSLRLSVAPALGRAWLLARLARYSALAPNLDIVLSASTLLDPLRTQACDLAIRYGPEPPAGFTTWALMRETLVPVCTPAFAAQSGLPDAAGLARARRLHHPLLPWADWFAAAAYTGPGIEEGPRFEDGALMLDACLAGHGIALAPHTLAAADLAAGRLLQAHPLAVPAGTYWLIAAPQALESPWVMRFARWLVADAHATAR